MRIWILLLFSAHFVFSEDFTLKIEGVEDEILVSLPKNHDSSRSWPAVFYYHGTNGRPRTRLIRGHAGDEDWIVVGMGYAKRGVFQLTPAGMDAEVAVLNEVKKQLEERANLDPERVYVSGFSKGGWVSGLLLQKEKSLAGGAILGAGHLHQLEAVPKPLRAGLPVFVGVGRYDRNSPSGLRALVFFRNLGAQVEMETWRGLEHRFPDWGSTGLKEWLRLRLGKEPEREALEAELAEIVALEDQFERWWSLVEFEERPFVKAVAEFEAQVEARRLELEKSKGLAREARILKESRRLLGKEIGKKTLQNLEEIVSGYARISEAAKGSPQGEVASKDYERVSEILDLARKEFGELEEQKRVREVKTPLSPGRRTVPRNPLVR